MNRHQTINIKAGTTLVGLALAAALTASLGCSDSGGGSTGTAGKGGSSGTAGTTGAAGSTGGTGGSTGGTGGSTAGTGGSTAGTGGSTGGTGGSTAGSGGSVGGSAGGAGGSTTGGTGGSAGGSGGAGGTPWLTLPANLPPTLNVPANATLKLKLHATGDQVYTCTASAPGGAGGSGAGGAGGGGATTYSWVLKQPDARLYDQSNTQVGTHGVGPNWTSTVDASVVNAARAYQENAPLADAIPWLLLRATSNTGTGTFSDVTYVIRANTTGGKAPATGCDATTTTTETRVAYTADYFFFNGGGPGTAWLTPPGNVPAAIAVPSGATVKRHDHAIGVQVYTCTASAAGGAGGAGGAAGGAGGAGGGGATTYSWVLKQPDAVLYDAAFAQVGTHGLGPNWTATDGSVVNGARVAQASSTMTGAIAWLLLSASSTTGTGVFSDVTYIQRLNTAGGPAPATGCDATTVNTEVRIPYSADYYFFTGGTTTTDGGTNG
jgi:hypothetical protein